MPFEECLYGILVASANEVANAVAEHVAGSRQAFADLMNDKAKELGCKNTHFVNAHGLHDKQHYTSAYDLALIGKAFFKMNSCPKSVTPHPIILRPQAPSLMIFMRETSTSLSAAQSPMKGSKAARPGTRTMPGRPLSPVRNKTA